MQASCKRWRASHPGAQTASTYAWKQKNRPYLAQKQSAREREAPALTKKELKELVDYYGDKCVYCGDPMTGVDHLQPLSKGGEHTLENLAPCCGECNSLKQAQPIWVMLGAT